MTLFSNNQSAIVLTKEHQYHAWTKHINICFHFIWWVVENSKLQLIYCPTEEMLANALTKALPSMKVKHFADAFGLARHWGGVLEEYNLRNNTYNSKCKSTSQRYWFLIFLFTFTCLLLLPSCFLTSPYHHLFLVCMCSWSHVFCYGLYTSFPVNWLSSNSSPFFQQVCIFFITSDPYFFITIVTFFGHWTACIVYLHTGSLINVSTVI